MGTSLRDRKNTALLYIGRVFKFWVLVPASSGQRCVGGGVLLCAHLLSVMLTAFIYFSCLSPAHRPVVAPRGREGAVPAGAFRREGQVPLPAPGPAERGGQLPAGHLHQARDQRGHGRHHATGESGCA